MTAQQLRRQRAQQSIAAAEAIHNAAARENRELTVGEQHRFDQHLAEADRIHQQILESEQMANDLQARTMNYNPTTDPPVPVFDASGTLPYTPPQSQPRLILPKLSAFRGPEAERNAYDSALWMRAFLFNDGPAKQQLESRRPQWLGSQNEGSPTSGGYAVPTEFHSAIIQYWDEVGATRRLATILPVGTDNGSIPKLTGDATVMRVGEETAITDSSMSFGSVSYGIKKLAVLVYVSAELAADSAVGIMDLIAQRIALQLSLAEDEDFIQGDGTSAHSGIMGVLPSVEAATAGIYTPTADEDAWEELTLATHLSTMALVQSKYRVRGELKWLCSTPYKWGVLDRITLGAGGALVQSMTGGVTSDQFAGYEVVTSDFMPTTTGVSQVSALFGNFKQSCLLAERQGIRLATSEHIKFAEDQIAIRATVRRDIQNHEMGSTSVAGGVVGLATHS